MPHVHCELGPVLVNRTAVYRMCLEAPTELARRGFQVSSSALLARLGDRAEPETALERRLFERSRRWLLWAIRRPGWFRRTRRLLGLAPRWRHGRDVSLFMDPLYPLFYGAPDRGAVICYDVTPVTDPDWHPGAVGALYEEAYALLARSRLHIIAACRTTADQLRATWGIPPSRVSVGHLGLFRFPEPAGAAAPRDEAPFFLFVGSVEPRKNVAGLIDAYRASGLFAARGIRLRLVGPPPGEGHALQRLAQTTPGVDLAGFVSDAELASAYRRCLAFVYPSFCEGFGLPLLEAMAHGCVCLSTVTGASPEVAGDAALYVNPYDPAEIAGGLRQVADLDAAGRQDLRRRARERAATFTWARFYDHVADVLTRAAGAA